MEIQGAYIAEVLFHSKVNYVDHRKTTHSIINNDTKYNS